MIALGFAEQDSLGERRPLARRIAPCTNKEHRAVPARFTQPKRCAPSGMAGSDDHDVVHRPTVDEMQIYFYRLTQWNYRFYFPVAFPRMRIRCA
jgi:hypothetical protein